MKVPRIITDALEGTGLELEIVSGKRHRKLYIDGHFMGILPHDCNKDSMGGRGGLNVASHIKRYAKTGRIRQQRIA